jgi:integrase/recombinase XerD
VADAFAMHLDRFLDHLRVERNLSPNTLEAYARDLSGMLAHLGTQGVRQPRQLDRSHLLRWLRSLAERGAKATSQARALSAARRFCAMLVRWQVLSSNPATDVEGPVRRRKLPALVSRAEAGRFVVAPKGESPRALRDRAALELLYAAGLRASELCDLRLDELHANLGVVRPRGKGRKERVVPVGQPALAALQHYLDAGRAALLKGRTSDHVFIGNRGQALSRSALFKIVRRYGRAAGIERPISPHKLRHAFATHLVQGGADLRSVQEMLGHANIATTEIYTHVQTDALRQTVDGYHPLGK